MSIIYERRRQQCEDILSRLLAAPRVPLTSATIPSTHGLYALAQKGASDEEFLHVGMSIGGGGLRDRICKQHRTQNGSADLITKILAKFPDRRTAREWVDENCTVQWIEEPDLSIRRAAEHYAEGILRPAWPGSN
jgi:hypothetical protein